LEYCAQYWSPYLRKDVNALESVQRRITRLTPGMGRWSYGEKLERLGLCPLEFRRGGDLVETFQMLRGVDRVAVERMFPLVGVSGTQGHCLKIRGCSFKTEMRRNMFYSRGLRVSGTLFLKGQGKQSLGKQSLGKQRLGKQRLGKQRLGKQRLGKQNLW